MPQLRVQRPPRQVASRHAVSSVHAAPSPPSSLVQTPASPRGLHVNAVGQASLALGSHAIAHAPSTQSRLAHASLVVHASPSASTRWQLPQLGLVPTRHS